MSADVIDIRRYAVVELEGEPQLACYSEGQWIFDATCEFINQMLRDEMVCEETVQAWTQKRLTRKR